MAAEMRRQLLAVAELDFDALEVAGVCDHPIGLLDADAEGDRFAANVAIVQYTERALLAHQRVADDVAFEEQLARRRGADLGIGVPQEPDDSHGQCNCGKGDEFHGHASQTDRDGQ